MKSTDCRYKLDPKDQVCPPLYQCEDCGHLTTHPGHQRGIPCPDRKQSTTRTGLKE